MTSPCDTARAAWFQLPHGAVGGTDVALLPQEWNDLGVATMSTMVALARGFAAWYTSPTEGCLVSTGPYSLSPYEDATWRLAALLTLWQYIEGAQGDEGIQALADYLFGADRARLRLAIMSEEDSPARLAWLRIALTVGIKGIQEQLLQIAERGGVESVVAGADLVLANWLPTTIDDATLRRATFAATSAMTPGPDAENLQKAGTALLARVQFIQATRAGSTTITPPPVIPPTAIVPVMRTWWSDNWPVVFGGAGGLVLFLIALWRRHRHVHSPGAIP